MPAYYLEILILLLGFAMLCVEAFSSNRSRSGIAVLGVSGLFIVLLFLIFAIPAFEDPYDHWGIYHVDKLALFYKAIAIVTTLLVLVLAKDFFLLSRNTLLKAMNFQGLVSTIVFLFSCAQGSCGWHQQRI